MSAGRRLLAAFDDWALEPPYREPRLSWRWHLAYAVFVCVAALRAGLLLDPVGVLIAAGVLLLLCVPGARRVYVREHPEARLDGRGAPRS